MSHRVPNWMVYSENPMYNAIWFVLQELGKVVECVCEGYKYLHLFTEWWDNGQGKYYGLKRVFDPIHHPI